MEPDSTTTIQLALRLGKVAPSATMALTAKAKAMKASGLEIVSFGAGEPDFDTPDVIKEAAIQSLNAGFTKYTPTSGTLELKEAVCKKFSEDQKLSYKPENIIISCGAKHSLFNLIQVLCDPGDEVIIPSPYWVSYPEMVRLAQAKPVFVPTVQEQGFGLTAESLERAITNKTKLVILNSPSNPTGAVIGEGELARIAELIVKRNLYCVSDEIYEYYLYDGQKHISIATLGEEIQKRTFVVNGVSKSYSMTGLRIGYLAGIPEVIKKIGILQDHSTSGPVSISQKMAVAALNMPKSYREEVRAKFEHRRDLMFDLIKQAEGLEPFKAQGAFYLFCSIKKTGMTSDDFCNQLLDQAHVSVIPGQSFGSDKHVRFSFATSEEDIQKGIQKMTDWIMEKKK